MYSTVFYTVSVGVVCVVCVVWQFIQACSMCTLSYNWMFVHVVVYMSYSCDVVTCMYMYPAVFYYK